MIKNTVEASIMTTSTDVHFLVFRYGRKSPGFIYFYSLCALFVLNCLVNFVNSSNIVGLGMVLGGLVYYKLCHINYYYYFVNTNHVVKINLNSISPKHNYSIVTKRIARSFDNDIFH
jgi:hypothetical protein